MKASSARETAISYLLDGCKTESERRIGMEAEYFCVRDSDGRRIPYEDDHGSVAGLLHGMSSQFGGTSTYDGPFIVGCEADCGSTTIEPGGQIEWSSPPSRSLAELYGHFDTWRQVFQRQLRFLKLRALNDAFDTRTDTTLVPWTPKERYVLMRQRYARNWQTAWSAMTRTAGIHINLDYKDAGDWQNKFLGMALLTPVAIALFANSPVGGNRSPWKAIRPTLWRSMDPPRCMLPPGVFDHEFTIRDYVDWLFQVPLFFRQHDFGLALAEDRTYADVAPSDATLHAFRLHLGTIFTPVRSSQRLEIRCIDQHDPERSKAVPAFFWGLFYSPDGPRQLLDILAGLKNGPRWNQAFNAACRRGLTADSDLSGLAVECLNLAISGLEQEPDPDQTALEQLNSLRQQTRQAAGYTGSRTATRNAGSETPGLSGQASQRRPRFEAPNPGSVNSVDPARRPGESGDASLRSGAQVR